MANLVASILCSVAIVHLLRLAAGRSVDVFPMFTVNYIVGAAIGAGGIGPAIRGGYPASYWALALILGVGFILGFVVLQRTVVAAGPGVAATISRLAVAVPATVSVVFYGESMTPAAVIGAVLAAVALPLAVSETPSTSEGAIRRAGGAVGWGVALFVVFGLNDVVFKVRDFSFGALDERAFVSVVFASALVFALAGAIIGRGRFSRDAVLFGVAVGAANFGSALFLTRALRSLPGYTTYLANSLGVIVLGAVSSILIWRERPGLRRVVGYGLAVAAVALVL